MDGDDAALTLENRLNVGYFRPRLPDTQTDLFPEVITLELVAVDSLNDPNGPSITLCCVSR